MIEITIEETNRSYQFNSAMEAVDFLFSIGPDFDSNLKEGVFEIWDKVKVIGASDSYTGSTIGETGIITRYKPNASFDINKPREEGYEVNHGYATNWWHKPENLELVEDEC